MKRLSILGPNDIGIAYLSAINKKLKRDAITDGLTGLYNHKYFKDSLEKEIERSERYKSHLSLLMIDVDNFKRYNDTHGHPEGDGLLQEIATIIKKNTRKVDLVARYGGEEFAVLMPSTPRTLRARIKSLETIGERLLNAVRNANHGTVTISIGAATYPKDTDLLRCADKALYKAKDTDKDKLVIYRK